MFKSFCNLRRNAIMALCAVSVAGAVSSCKDDYTWDDGNPSWLGSSIYDYLQEDGNYKNFTKLIDDLNYKEVLSKTGSKTLFVANDDAFNTFYQTNSWGVKSYDQLTQSQKKVLLHSAMINNAYLLEMMSSTAAGTGDNDEPEKGQCLRRETASENTDSVSHLFEADIPHSYNSDDKDYWSRFRNSEKGIYLALDATTPMMTHFLATQMAAQNITDDDFEKIIGKTREKSDAYIYDCKVLKQDVTCQNGYINVLDKVLITPQNLAEVLRTGSNSKIFSHMIDRFSAPFYNSTLTENYRMVYGNSVDSVFQKRYFSDRSQGNSTLYSDANTDPKGNPTGNTVFNTNSNKPLPFDPGWNQYKSDAQTDKEQDMAVIFCPTDDKLMNYFFSQAGGGRFLVKAYAPDLVDKINEKTTDLELVYQAIDQIPRQTIRALLNNLMKESFLSSVPSKFATIKNSAQDAMFDEADNYHVNRILETKLANNGIIYMMDEVTTPAEYAAVSAPAYVETNKRIFNWAVQSDKLGGIPTNYYAYLLAMSSRFSFFVPNDEGSTVDGKNGILYIDPLSFYNPTVNQGESGATLTGRAYFYQWDEKNSAPTVKSYEYIYDITSGEGHLGDQKSSETVSATCYGNRLKDMLETHTIIHEDNSESTGIDETSTGVECNQHYFVSKNGSVIHVNNASQRADGMSVEGGWQLANKETCDVTGFDDKSAQTNGYGNGYAYMINKPMMPTIESVYSALYENPDFHYFFELCQTDEDVLKALDITGNAQNKYKIFVDNKGIPCYDKSSGQKVASTTNVRFFNNYRYTVYVPDSTAMKEAFKNGLPKWSDIRKLLELDKEEGEEMDDLTEEEEAARIVKATAMCTAIVNFVKNHFQDNSIFADDPAISETPYETATINSSTGVYCKLKVSSQGNGTLTVKDPAGNVRNITKDKNIIARDYITNGASTAITTTLTSSSSAVIHGIDGALDYRETTEGGGGRWDTNFATPAKARAYLNKYRLTK